MANTTTPFAGAWLASAAQPVPDAPGHVVHTADAAHSAATGEDPNAWTWSSPTTIPPLAGPDVPEYPGMEWVTTTSGVVLDQSPWEHDVPDGPAEHARDLGGPLRHSYQPAPLQDAGTVYQHQRVQGFGPGSTEINPVALQRGRNGLAENNPDGFRPGYTDTDYVNRKIYYQPERRHDRRPIYLNVATVGVDKPPPAGTTPAGPFSAFARIIRRSWQTPQMRRVPPPIDESVLADPDAYPAASGTEWVVG